MAFDSRNGMKFKMGMTRWNTDALSTLPTFQALLDHGSVSKAAEALGVSQSAVSKHLARLREAYRDPLFVRTPGGMRPTPHAIWMSARVSTILAEAQVLREARVFDPSDLTGEVTIATTDELRRSLIPRIMEILDADAPRVRLTVKSLQSDYFYRELEAGQTDLVISVNWHAPVGLKQGRLFVDHFVCLMAAEDCLPEDALDLETFIALPHVLVAPFGMTQGAVDEALAQMEKSRFVRLSVPDFQLITPELLGSRYIVTLPSWVAKSLQERYSNAFTVYQPPVSVPSISYYALWHERFDKDPKNIWLRKQVKSVLS